MIKVNNVPTTQSHAPQEAKPGENIQTSSVLRHCTQHDQSGYGDHNTEDPKKCQKHKILTAFQLFSSHFLPPTLFTTIILLSMGG